MPCSSPSLRMSSAASQVQSMYCFLVETPAYYVRIAIVSAYFLGTSLFPEAKTYRLLADVLNDLAVICDVVSPHLDDFASVFTSFHFGSGLRITALCMSGCLRSLCGCVAGGSKAALTVHFATTSNGTGDVGDLNAKDGSKETVLVLLGLLVNIKCTLRRLVSSAFYVSAERPFSRMSQQCGRHTLRCSSCSRATLARIISRSAASQCEHSIGNVRPSLGIGFGVMDIVRLLSFVGFSQLTIVRLDRRCRFNSSPSVIG